jgi:hypothetical protein
VAAKDIFSEATESQRLGAEPSISAPRAMDAPKLMFTLRAVSHRMTAVDACQKGATMSTDCEQPMSKHSSLLSRLSLSKLQPYFVEIQQAAEPVTTGRGSSKDLAERVGPPTFLHPAVSEGSKPTRKKPVKLQPAAECGPKVTPQPRSIVSSRVSTTSLEAQSHGFFSRTREQSPSKPILLRRSPNLFSRKNTHSVLKISRFDRQDSQQQNSQERKKKVSFSKTLTVVYFKPRCQGLKVESDLSDGHNETQSGVSKEPLTC